MSHPWPATKGPQAFPQGSAGLLALPPLSQGRHPPAAAPFPLVLGGETWNLGPSVSCSISSCVVFILSQLQSPRTAHDGPRPPRVSRTHLCPGSLSWLSGLRCPTAPPGLFGVIFWVRVFQVRRLPLLWLRCWTLLSQGKMILRNFSLDDSRTYPWPSLESARERLFWQD